jgi:hypothetical protein
VSLVPSKYILVGKGLLRTRESERDERKEQQELCAQKERQIDYMR